MGTDLAGQHRGCEERLIESLSLREELVLEKVQCLANHAMHYSGSVEALQNRVQRCMFLFLVLPLYGMGTSLSFFYKNI
jgi:hypothetical protein